MCYDIFEEKKGDVMNFNIEFLNFWHFVIIAFVVLLPVVFTVIFKNKSEKTKKLFLLIVAIADVVIFVWRIIRISKEAWFNIWDELPLHLCSIGIIINLIAVVFNSRLMYSFSYCYSSVGAFLAVLIPTVHFIGSPIYNIDNITFYLQHAMIVSFGISARSLGFVKFPLKDVFKSTALLFGFAFLAHGANLAIKALELGNPNYMFTVDASINPVLQMFYNLCPIPLVYLFLLLPIVALIAFIAYLPTLIGNFKKKK